MTEMALTVRGLCKAYPRFRLEDVSLNVPRGTVVGLIGENGAGKSTLISAALGLVKRDAGAVSVLGKETLDTKTLGQVGVVFDGNNFPDVLSPAKLGRVLANNILMLDPDRVVIGGGISKQSDILIPLLEKQTNRQLPPQYRQLAEIVPARLANDAALFGAVKPFYETGADT